MVWEDINLLYEGLEIDENDNVLSICSAGDNVLGLLLKEPKSVTSIDLNPTQSAILELKLAAIKTIDHNEFLNLIGLKKEIPAHGIYGKLRSSLPDYVKNYWDENQEALKRGILWQGRLEQYIRKYQTNHLYPRVPQLKIENCFEMNKLSDQLSFFNIHFSSDDFRENFEWYFGEEVMGQSGRDKAQFAFVDEENVGSYFYKRFKYAFTRMPLKDNFYLELFLTAKLKDPSRMHPYLLEGNYKKLKSLVDRVEVVTEELEELLQKTPKGHFSKANFSDIFEYMPIELAENVFRALHDSFRKNGRICYWCLLVPRDMPDNLSNIFKSHQEAALNLWQKDRSWFYRSFHVEEVL